MSSAATSAAVYGGDEINAIVVDAGSYSTRIGYAGDDFPKVIQPLRASRDEDGTLHFESSLDFPRSGREVVPLIKDGVVQDWDTQVAQYRHIFDDVMHMEYTEQPLLVTEPVWTEQGYRQKMVETLYELFDFPALYLARAPTCISFQQGRLCCLVVDIGHDSVSVVAVVDGICLHKNAMKTNYAGQYLNDRIRDVLQAKFPDLDLVAKYKVQAKTPTTYPAAAQYTARNVPSDVAQSFDEYQQQKTYADFKELMVAVPEKKVSAANTYLLDEHLRSMEFPLGQSVEIAEDRYALGDSLFEPAAYEFASLDTRAKYPPNNGELGLTTPYDDYRPMKRARKGDAALTPTPAPDSEGPSVRGLAHMVLHVIASVDIDLRTQIAHNIIVTGGTLLVPGLTERLSAELLAANPGLKIRLHALGNAHERTNQTWIGGSVLASLGTFHQMWVSKEEYDEAGPERILTQRFR